MYNVYFAGYHSKINDYILVNDCNQLLNYATDKKQIREFYECGYGPNLLIDSGAFPVAYSNAKVDIDEYIDFINTHPLINNFIQLDVIPKDKHYETAIRCAEQTYYNYIYMKQRIKTNCNLLPVYHYTEPLVYLRQILQNKPDYICIGGLVGKGQREQEIYLHNIFECIEQECGKIIKVHALGLAVTDLCERFPIYSSDSTHWLKTAVYGGIVTDYSDVLLSDRTIKFAKHLNNLPYSKQILKQIQQANFDINKLKVSIYERLKYNIQWYDTWATNYIYKGPKSFITNSLF